MLFDIDVFLDYDLSYKDAALLMIEAAHKDGQRIVNSHLDVENGYLRMTNASGALENRAWAVVPDRRLQARYRATVDVTRADYVLDALPATPIDALPSAVLPFLRPSRFCPSDMFVPFVATKFAGRKGGALVVAIRDWVGTALSYVPGSSVSTTSAMETFISRQGVCRDYAHMVCALARAASIPARYVAAYGPDVVPPDFHAVAEVWLDGAWHLVDATGMSAPSALIVIGAGRDCGDVAFMETENEAYFRELSVRVHRA